jgi:hypothetical protein
MTGFLRTASPVPTVSQAWGRTEGHALSRGDRTGRYRRKRAGDFGQASRIGQFVTRDFRQ